MMHTDWNFREIAWKLIHDMGKSTMFDEKQFNEGMTLPFHVAKKCALVAVELLIKDEEMYMNGEPNPVNYWRQVKAKIEKYAL